MRNDDLMRDKRFWIAVGAIMLLAMTAGCATPSPSEQESMARMERILKTIPLPATMLTKTNVVILVSTSKNRDEFLIMNIDGGTRMNVPMITLLQWGTEVVPNSDMVGVQNILYEYWRYRTRDIK